MPASPWQHERLKAFPKVPQSLLENQTPSEICSLTLHQGRGLWGERCVGQVSAFSCFRATRKTVLPMSPIPLPKASLELRYYTLHVLRCSWSLSSSPVDSETVHGGCRAVTGGHCSKAARPGLSLELIQTTSYSVIVVKTAQFPVATTEMLHLSRKSDPSWLCLH